MPDSPAAETPASACSMVGSMETATEAATRPIAAAGTIAVYVLRSRSSSLLSGGDATIMTTGKSACSSGGVRDGGVAYHCESAETAFTAPIGPTINSSCESPPSHALTPLGAAGAAALASSSAPASSSPSSSASAYESAPAAAAASAPPLPLQRPAAVARGHSSPQQKRRRCEARSCGSSTRASFRRSAAQARMAEKQSPRPASCSSMRPKSESCDAVHRMEATLPPVLPTRHAATPTAVKSRPIEAGSAATRGGAARSSRGAGGAAAGPARRRGDE